MLQFALAAALLAPQDATQVTAPIEAPVAVEAPSFPEHPTGPDGLFWAPSGPMTLVVGDADNPLTYESMVSQYAELTGQHSITSSDCQGLLRQALHLDRTLVVPAADVQATFESILRQGNFVLRPLTRRGVGVVEIESLDGSARNNIRSWAIFLSEDRIQQAARHPAVIFTATITLPSTDVRQVSNSMRTMITDANTQQLLPAGNSNSMVLVDFGDRVASTAESLRLIDAASAAGAEGSKLITEVIRLEHAVPKDLVTLLDSAYGVDPTERKRLDPKFLADPRTNSLLITVRERQVDGIKDLIAVLDVE